MTSADHVPPPSGEVLQQGELGQESPKLPAGYEYDEFYAAYEHHPNNGEFVRYCRDFDGFGIELPKAVYIPPTEDRGSAAAMIADIRRFPVLRGLQHELALKNRIDAGLAAFELLKDSEELNPKEIAELEQRAIEGAGAYQTMFECNQRLILKVVGKYDDVPSYEVEDMIQKGREGLRRAVQKYDTTLGWKFSTYAMRWIGQKIGYGRTRMGHAVALPQASATKMQKIKSMSTIDEAGRRIWPTDEYLRKRGISPVLKRSAQLFMTNDVRSLEQPWRADSDVELGATIPGAQVNFDEAFEDDTVPTLQGILDMAGVTNPRTRLIMSMRAGVQLAELDYEGYFTVDDRGRVTTAKDLMDSSVTAGMLISMQSISGLLGISRERVRQINVEGEAAILLHYAMAALTKRLGLTPHEAAKIQAYIGLRNPDKLVNTKERFERSQRRAAQSLDLLGLLDLDLRNAANETLRTYEVDDKKGILFLQRLRDWHAARFPASGRAERYVTGVTEAKSYHIGTFAARMADARFAAVLSGVWGKIMPVIKPLD